MVELVGGAVLRSRPVVSMKNGADRSVVLAPGGTDALAATQAGWAMAAGTTHAAESNAPAITVNVFFILCRLPCRRVQPARKGR
jgi:hypothetical protein